MSEEEMTFEEFNKHIDESHDEGCGMCFSFHHFAHLDQASRKIAYLGFIGKFDECLQAVADELDRLEKEPINDNIYFLLTQTELALVENLKPEPALRDRITLQLARRANEMIHKKMPAAWVAVRAYGWFPENDPIMLVGFLEECEGTDWEYLDVWQTVLQCVCPNIPIRERAMVGPERKSLCLAYMKRKVHDYTLKAIEMGDEIKTYVVAVNGIKAMAAMQDPRVLEMMDKLPRHNLDRIIKEDVEHQIAYLTKVGDTEFIPTLRQLQERCQNKL